MAGNRADRAISTTHQPEDGRGRDWAPSGPGAESRKPDTTVSLREARRQLELVCQMLLGPSPEVLNGCKDLLTSAATELEASRPDWRTAAGDRVASEEARLARKALKHAQRLLENAANFHARWQRIRAALCGGYRADGAPGQLRCAARRISVEG